MDVVTHLFDQFAYFSTTFLLSFNILAFTQASTCEMLFNFRHVDKILEDRNVRNQVARVARVFIFDLS